MAKSKAKKNRAALARSRGKRLCMFELTDKFDALLERVREALAADTGGCSRTRALETIGRLGAEKFLSGRNPNGDNE